MSFRFCDRSCKPSRARVPPFRTHAAAGGFPSDGETDYGRFRVGNVVRTVAGLLRALLGCPFALRRRAPVAPVLEQLGRPLRADRLDRVGRPQAGIRLAVGHVRAEPALLEDDRLPADRVVAELLQRRRGRSAAALFRLGELGQRLVEGDREQLLLAVERARSPCPSSRRGRSGRSPRGPPRRRTRRARAGASGACSASSSVTVSGDIVLKSDAVRGFSSPSDHLGDVRAVAAGAHGDRAPALRVGRRARAPGCPGRGSPRRARRSARRARCRAAASAGRCRARGTARTCRRERRCRCPAARPC